MSTTTRSRRAQHTGRSGRPRFALDQILQQLEVLAVGSAHRELHDWFHQPREAGRLAAVPEGHVRTPGRGVAPRVGRLHEEWTAVGAHPQALARDELANLVGVLEPASEEFGHEREL